MTIMSQPDEHTQKLIKIHENRLKKIEEQIATQGETSAPVSLLIERDNLREIIAGLKGEQISPGNTGLFDALDFQNQQKAITAIITQPQAGNIVINGPAGYGKTYLLKQLATHLSREKWHVRTISFRERGIDPMNQRNAIASIARGVGLRLYGGESSDDIGRGIATHLANESSNDFPGIKFTGAFLIIDSAEYMFREISERPYKALRSFFNAINTASAAFQDFRIRVILSGRYLVDERLSVLEGRMPSIDLEVFDLQVIQQAVDSFFAVRGPRRTPSWNRHLAKHILYITGGHPLMIRNLLLDQAELIQRSDLNTWLKKNKDHLLAKIVTPTIAEIKSDIPERETLWSELLNLCVYRKFNSQIIRELFPEKRERTFQYTDKLERYGLATREGSSYKDGVLRPAIMRWFQFSDFAEFRNYCNKAKSIYSRQLTEIKSGGFRPHALLRELLYILLLEAHEVAFISEATNIKEHLQWIHREMREYCHQAMKVHIASSNVDGQEEFAYELRRTLQRDTELEFLFDYLFGDEDNPASDSYADFVHELSDSTQRSEL